jgi:hypothetical protein
MIRDPLSRTFSSTRVLRRTILRRRRVHVCELERLEQRPRRLADVPAPTTEPWFHVVDIDAVSPEWQIRELELSHGYGEMDWIRGGVIVHRIIRVDIHDAARRDHSCHGDAVRPIDWPRSAKRRDRGAARPVGPHERGDVHLHVRRDVERAAGRPAERVLMQQRQHHRRQQRQPRRPQPRRVVRRERSVPASACARRRASTATSVGSRIPSR